MPSPTVEEQMEKLLTSVEKTAQSLADVNAKMVKSNEQVGDALLRIKKIETGQESVANAEAEIKKLTLSLDSLATKVTSLAEQNTNLITIQRANTNAIAARGGHDGVAFRVQNSKGSAIFESRQQAVEIGMFLMATMNRESSSTQYAKKWIREHWNDLQHLPQVPKWAALDGKLNQNMDNVVKRLQSQGLSYAAQDLASNATPGSSLVFPEFMNTMIRNVEEYGAFRRNATIWPMKSNQVYIPRRKSGLSVYWVTEAAAPSETDPSFDMLKLEVKKYAALSQYSSELAEDEMGAIALASLYVTEFAQAVAYEEDRIGFNGTGAGGNATTGYAGFLGVLGCDRQAYAAEGSEDLDKVLKYDAATGLDRTDEVTLKGLRAVTGLCHTWALPNAKWFMHRTVAADLEGIETTGGGPIMSVDSTNTKSLLGYPLERCEAMPASPGTASTGTFAFGDLRKGWIMGDRRAMSIETSEHYAFNTDQITTRLTGRTGWLPWQPTAIVVYVTAA